MQSESALFGMTLEGQSNFAAVQTALDMIWLSPGEMRERILQSWVGDREKRDVFVGGTPDAPYAVLFEQGRCHVQGNINDAALLGVLSAPDAAALPGETKISRSYAISERVRKRFELPTVLLASFFHPERYPAARLNLSISYLAAYLRARLLGNVTILDCQYDIGVEDILRHITMQTPEIVGVSVNFGQMDLLEKFMAGFRALNLSKPPLIVFGNILPSMCASEVLAQYPEVIICVKEGEETIAALADLRGDRDRLSEVPGIIYVDARRGETRRTAPRSVDLDLLSPPAPDTIQELFERDGVLTAEFSRGCHYNICSFCPRSHKGGVWRPMSAARMAEHMQYYSRMCAQIGREPYIFLADEEFIGRIPGDQGDATERRIEDFIAEMDARGLNCQFDIAIRADQVFMRDRDRDWHIRRGHIIRGLIRVGLKRIFIGVESGADAQLTRYLKGNDRDTIISALRYLSLLGASLRFGFITFDPLMDAEDLFQNIDFLGRSDVLLPPQPEISPEALFAEVEAMRTGPEASAATAGGRPVYTDVSYMVSPLEVLVKSRYLHQLKQQAPDLIEPGVDLSFARVNTRYRNPDIEKICRLSQSWVEYCFPLLYALKGMQKVSSGSTRSSLTRCIRRHRELSYELLRALAELYLRPEPGRVAAWDLEGELPATVKHVLGLDEPVDVRAASVLRVYAGLLLQEATAFDGDARAVLEAEKRKLWDGVFGSWSKEAIDTSVYRRVT